MAIQQYKVECLTVTSIDYFPSPFEVYFDNEDSMLDFIENVPESYRTEYYKKDKNSAWELIGRGYTNESTR